MRRIKLEDEHGVIRLKDVKAKRVRYFWDSFCPRGKLTIFEGSPGRGKSYLLLKVMAMASRGELLPGDPKKHKPRSSLLFTTEDDPADAIRPRLEAMGADFDLINMVRYPQGLIDGGIDFIRETIIREKPQFSCFDPILQYLDASLNSNDGGQVRHHLSEYQAIAEDARCAIAIVRHLRKAGGGLEISGAGSMQYTATVRSACRVAIDPRNQDQLVVQQFKSTGKKLADAQIFKLVPKEDDFCDIEFLGPPPEGRYSDSEIEAGDHHKPAKKGAPKLKEARKFVRTITANGPIDGKKAMAEAKAQGIAPKTLRNAREREGVTYTRKGQGKDRVCYWNPPQPGRKRKAKRKRAR